MVLGNLLLFKAIRTVSLRKPSIKCLRVKVHLPPTLDHLGLGFSSFDQFGGLVSPSDLTSMIGHLFPIPLWGRSSL